MHPLLAQLQHKQWLWQGHQTQAPFRACCASGWPALDQWLGGGWPSQGCLQLQSVNGSAELQLVQQLFHHSRLVVAINPPARLCAEGWPEQRQQLWQIQASNKADALWASEQCLHSGSCAVVLLWHTEFSLSQFKRLQLAAEQSQSLLLCLHNSAVSAASLPWDLSLRLQPGQDGLQLDMRKRKGFAQSHPMHLSWTELYPDWFYTAGPQQSLTPHPFPVAS